MCYKYDFLKVGINCGIFKQALENSSNKLRAPVAQKNLLKIVKNWTVSQSLLTGQRCSNETLESL